MRVINVRNNISAEGNHQVDMILTFTESVNVLFFCNSQRSQKILYTRSLQINGQSIDSNNTCCILLITNTIHSMFEVVPIVGEILATEY